MAARSNRQQRGKSRERSPLRPQRFSTSYGASGSQPPPSYTSTDGHRFQRTSANQRSQYLLPLRPTTSTKHGPTVFTRKGCLCFGGFVVFLIILAQAVVLIFFYDLPSKLDAYGKATARMREQRDAMMEQAKHLEGERRLLEQEEKDLRGERERWEKAREDRVPQGAFWDVIWPAEDCRAYGTREYRAVLQNIPEDWTDVDACMNMPIEIKGVRIRRPLRCERAADSPHIYGIWMVDWNQPDCKPWHHGITDKVLNLGKPSNWTSLTNANLRAAQTWDLESVVSNPGSWVSRIIQHKTGACCARPRL
jgi:hypothetical protein